MDCVMDGVNLPQTYLTGHAIEEILHLQIRDLHQITLLETVEIITLYSTKYKIYFNQNCYNLFRSIYYCYYC